MSRHREAATGDLPGPAMPLDGLRVVEVGSFIAVPSAGLALRQLGALVIRVDPVGGAPDIARCPLGRLPWPA